MALLEAPAMSFYCMLTGECDDPVNETWQSNEDSPLFGRIY